VTALVGLDVGTTGVKAIAISPDGEVLGRAEHVYPLSTPQPGWSEQDPADWWQAAEAALAEVCAGREVAGIGLSGQMHGLVALDEEDRVLRPAILWNDQRTAVECVEIEERVGLERLIALTGNRALTGFTAPKLLWLRRHEPETYARIRHVLLPKDYVRLRLTGERAIDVADASGTLLLDVAHRRWSAEVLTALGLPGEWLPSLLESPEVSGRTPHGTPVAAGAGDQPAAALGVGIDAPGPVSAWQRGQRPALGRLAVELGWLDQRDVADLLERRRREGAQAELIGQFAVRRGVLTRTQLLALVGRQNDDTQAGVRRGQGLRAFASAIGAAVDHHPHRVPALARAAHRVEQHRAGVVARDDHQVGGARDHRASSWRK